MGPAHASAAHRRAEEVLTEGALSSFRDELPHAWHRGTEALLRPLGRAVPDAGGPMQPARPLQLAALRRDLASIGSGVFLVDEDDGRGAPRHRKWRAWLHEGCRVLGLEASTKPLGRQEEPPLPAAAAEGLGPGQEAAKRGGGVPASRPLCPELWVDEAWPPSSHAPSAEHQVPVWSMPAPKARGLIVLQARLLQEYPPREVKALIGFELGRTVFVQPPAIVPPGWWNRLGRAYLAGRFMQASAPWGRKRAPLWAPLFALRRASHGTGLLPGPIATLFGTPQPRHSFNRGWLNWHTQTPLEVLAPWLLVAGQAGLLEAGRRLQGTRGRSLVLTLDRAAALAAGDARAAAAALMRARGLLPKDVAGTPEQLDRLLETAAATSERQVWLWRRESALKNPQEPRAEVRVLELLRWSETEAGRRLIALAQMRRVRQRRLSWLQTLRGMRPADEGESGEAGPSWLGRWPRTGYGILLALLALPFATTVDAVRWASLCTLLLTATGVLLPFAGGGVVQLPPLLGLGLSGLLAVYAAFVYSIWWNHLLGGWHRWAKLSSELSAQLLDQADVTAGIAYLARDWAELARRSLAALDQELCGSWRTSLHELASKLTDLRQELEGAGQHAEGQGLVGRATSVPALPMASLGTGPGSLALQLVRHRTTAALPAPPPVPLWQKVDRAVQRAAQVEASRMRCTLDADPEQIQAMQTWWRTGRANVGAAELALCQGQGLGAPNETFGDLLVTERLHLRFPYPSFHGDGASASEADAGPSSEDFRRLEKALQQNLQSLQELRGRLTPWEDTKTALFWTWADVRAISARFQRAIGWVPQVASRAKVSNTGAAGPEVANDPKDQLAELSMMSCLFLACCAGLFCASSTAMNGRWGWMAGTFSFSVANAVLLLNYSRLYLPHVRRRFERRLVELSRQQEALLQEVSMAQRSSQRARVVHNKAAIFLQSVNVIRNVNYLALCVKTEVQRAAAGNRPSRQQRQCIASCGLQLLLALLPHSDQQWRCEALAGEDCANVAALLYGPQAVRGVLSSSERARMMSSFEESQKRLWILFRMVHLSSVLPCEVQGQLSALVERYLRPVLVERRVPLDRRPTLEGHDTNGRGALLDASPRRGALPDALPSRRAEVFDLTERDEQDAQALDALAVQDAEERQEGPWSPKASGQRKRGSSDAGSVDEDRRDSFCAGSSASRSSQRSADCVPVETSRALRKLTATRSDIARVLARLPAAALVGPPSQSPQAKSVLGDIFSSVILLLPSSCLTSPGNAEAAARDAAEGNIVVAASVGHHYGERSYHWQRLRTSLAIEVCVSAPDARDLGVNCGSGPMEVSVPLTLVLDEEPPRLATASAWSSLSSGAPLRFGDASLRSRRRALRRAKDVLRYMG